MGMFEVIKLDIRIIEETKRKYLDMLTTKIFLNKEEVVVLTHGARKTVVVICPLCSKQKVRHYADISRTGHTLCRGCSKSIKVNIPTLGTKKGRLLIYDFVLPHQSIKKWQAQFKAICDCGKKVNVSAQSIKKGDTTSCGCYFMDMCQGENNPNYNPHLPMEERNGKRGYAAERWAKEVKRRDNYTCQVCWSIENIIAHHLNSYKSDKEARYNIENGITLCRECHTDFHLNFMGNYRIPCTSEDFEQYLLQV